MSRTEDDAVFTVGDALPLLENVSLGSGRFEVVVTFRDATRRVVDLAPDIFTFKSYAALRDDLALFATVHVVNDGAAIAWGIDDGIDMPVTAIERLAEETWAASDFQAFLKENKLTRDAAAAQLGISRRLVGYYAMGRSIPRHIALACAYITQTRCRVEDGTMVVNTGIIACTEAARSLMGTGVVKYREAGHGIITTAGSRREDWPTTPYASPLDPPFTGDPIGTGKRKR